MPFYVKGLYIFFIHYIIGLEALSQAYCLLLQFCLTNVSFVLWRDINLLANSWFGIYIAWATSMMKCLMEPQLFMVHWMSLCWLGKFIQLAFRLLFSAYSHARLKIRLSVSSLSLLLWNIILKLLGLNFFNLSHEIPTS